MNRFGSFGELPRLVWIFAAFALAGIAGATIDLVRGFDSWSHFATPDPATFALTRLGSAFGSAALILVPAGVAVWRPDWRRSPATRLVFAGALIWALSSIWWSTWMALDQLGLMRPNVPVASWLGIAAVFGPLVMVAGLAMLRRTAMTWPPVLILVVLIVTGLTVPVRLHNLYEYWDATHALADPAAYSGSHPDPLTLARTLVGSLWPLSLGILAWMSLSAARAGESALKRWRWLAGGAALAVAADILLTALIASYTVWGVFPNYSLVLTGVDLAATAGLALGQAVVLYAFLGGVGGDTGAPEPASA